MPIIVDPPEGWRYGFPKEMPENLLPEDFEDWILDNGYPKEKRDKYGEHFYCRFWTREEK